MKIKSFLLIAVIITANVAPSLADSDWYVTWVDGHIYPPPCEWIVTTSPDGMAFFSGPTQVSSNDCYAIKYYGGTPTITINHEQKTVELWFEGPPPDLCYDLWAPVCGLQGSFGPLTEGDWIFFTQLVNPFPYPPTYISIPFQIAPQPKLTLLAPNGGQFILAGSISTISWKDSRSTDTCTDDYLLDYSTDNGDTWLPVDPNIISDTCLYQWLTPLIDANQCLIRITDANDPNITDNSDDIFCIYQCVEPPLRDLNSDCYVNFSDFALMASSWPDEHCSGQNDWCNGLDFDKNGSIDLTDLAELFLSWCTCTNPYDPACQN